MFIGSKFPELCTQAPGTNPARPAAAPETTADPPVPSPGCPAQAPAVWGWLVGDGTKEPAAEALLLWENSLPKSGKQIKAHFD